MYLNDNNLNLQFTGHMDSRSIDFLDVTLVGIIEKIEPQLFRKALAGNTLLRADSSHPKHNQRDTCWTIFKIEENM